VRISFGTTIGALLFAGAVHAQENAAPGDSLRALTGLDADGVAASVKILALVTVFGVVPSIVLLATSFPRILIVLSFLRRALGTQDLPSNQVIGGLALILTVLVMMPVWKRMHAEAYVPFQRGDIKTVDEALEKASKTLKQFMLAHTLEKDLRLFVELSEAQAGGGISAQRGTEAAVDGPVEDLSFFVILPAFVLSELKLAFQMGFLLYLPFLVIDLAVSAVLISMGMFLLPPVLVSLPLKVLIFVLADGWNLLVGQLIEGFRLFG